MFGAELLSGTLFLFIPVARGESAAMDKERLISLDEMRSYLYDTSSFPYKHLNKVAAGWMEITRRSPESLPRLLLAVL